MAAATRESVGVASVDRATAANLRLFTGYSLFLYLRNTLKVALQRNSLHYVKVTVNGNNRSLYSNVLTLFSIQPVNSYSQCLGILL